jgi:hypothetical protein
MSPAEPTRSRIGFEAPAVSSGKALKGRTVQLRKKV